MRFGELLDLVADVDPEMRVRFTSPHPKDFPDEVLQIINSRANVGKQLHMPAQSGSTSVLERMRRGYSREAYLDLATKVRLTIPGVAISSDFIAGFCGETEEEHLDTVTLMDRVAYEQAFMFAYSERDGTSAARKMEDDVPEDVKQRRLQEVIDAFRGAAARHQNAEIGRTHLCSVEGASKKNDQELTGKTDTSKWVVFKNDPVGIYGGDVEEESNHEAEDGETVVVNGGFGEKLATPKPGEYVAVRVTGCSTGTLFGECLGRTTLTAFHEMHGNAWVEADESAKKATAAAGAR
uniref:Uncharacterized protein n=2 Tax=Micromonas pusilla TaxID=38833 RepID=A0A7S0GQW6_MICPS